MKALRFTHIEEFDIIAVTSSNLIYSIFTINYNPTLPTKKARSPVVAEIAVRTFRLFRHLCFHDLRYIVTGRCYRNV